MKYYKDGSSEYKRRTDIVIHNLISVDSILYDMYKETLDIFAPSPRKNPYAKRDYNNDNNTNSGSGDFNVSTTNTNRGIFNENTSVERNLGLDVSSDS